MSNREVKSIHKGLSVYKDLLDGISEDDFTKLPANGGWSFSQLYSHIISVNKLALISIEKCINGTAKRNSRRLHWKVWLIMLIGKLPPGRIKAPERIEAMVSSVSREEAKNQLIRFSQRLEEIYKNISKASPDMKVSHPILGPLNARHWMRFIDIHTRHHIAQLERIRRSML